MGDGDDEHVALGNHTLGHGKIHMLADAHHEVFFHCRAPKAEPTRAGIYVPLDWVVL